MPGCSEDRDACMDADVSIDSFPAKDFGVLSGKVTRIGSDALEPDPREQREQLSFPVTIYLPQQQLQLKNGSSLPLQVGMSLTANIKLRTVTYLQLLWASSRIKQTHFSGFEKLRPRIQLHAINCIDILAFMLFWPIGEYCTAIFL